MMSHPITSLAKARRSGTWSMGNHASRARASLLHLHANKPIGAETPDSDALAPFHVRTDGAVVGSRNNVAEIQRFLVRNGIRDLKQVDVAEGCPTQDTGIEVRKLEAASHGQRVPPRVS